MLYKSIPCGNKFGSGASGSRWPSLNKSFIELGSPACVFPFAFFSEVVCHLASPKTIPSSVVWSVLSTSSHAAPVVVTAASDIVVDEYSEDIVISLMGSETDPYFYDSDGDSLNFDVVTYGSGVVSAMVEVDSLHLSFSPNFFGEDTVVIIATDPSGDDVMDTLIVTVNSVDDTPEIVDAPSFETMEDDSFDVFIYQFVIRDPDTQFESITLDISPADETDPIVNQYSINPIQYGFRIY